MAFYVTTPIYYVNAAPHLGHAYTTIAADVLARHMRQRGEEVFFLTGTDEHGEPVALAAEREGITPKELGDRNVEHFQALLPRLEATNDFFIRTSDPRHEQRVQEILQRVHDNGHVYKGTYEGWYCPRCADFKSDQEAGEDHTCPIHKIPLDREREDNWFFRLSSFQELMPRINASNDFFIRTSDPRHKKRVQEVMQRVHDNGHVYKGAYEGWYCPRCAVFKSDQEIAEANTCRTHLTPLEG